MVTLLLHDEITRFLKKPESVKHFLMIGNICYFGYLRSLKNFPSLTKVTLCKNYFVRGFNFWNEFPSSVQSVSLVDCAALGYEYFLTLIVSSETNKYWRSVIDTLPHSPLPAESSKRKVQTSLCYIEWKWLPGTSFRLDMVRDDNSHHTRKNESVMQKFLDEKGLIWSYPDAQLQWLITSLNNLDAMVLEAVQFVDEHWQKIRLVWLSNLVI